MRPVALVTGGGRGIGLAISVALAKDGHDIAICDIRPAEESKDAIASLESHGGRVLYVQADISKTADHERLLASIKDELGALHVLVNNAGVAPTVRGDLLEASEESFDRLISINLRGPYFLTRLMANYMVEQKKADPTYNGCIQFISSISATVVSTSRGDYCISKAGVAMTAQLYAARMAEFGIPCYDIRPGVIRTDMTSGVVEKYDKLIAGGLTLEPRWGTPEDIGRCSAMLARGDLPYATGQVLHIDGGLTVQTL